MSANGRRAGWATRAAAHGVGAALAAAGLFFTAWALMLPPLREILFPWPLTFFSQLLERWAWGGGSLDTRGLAFGLAAIAVLTVIGTFILECFELYLPAAARLALAYLLGLGIGGVVLEWLAIPHLLSRETMALALGGLLLALMVGAWWRGRRPPETGAGGEADFAAQQMRHSLARQAWRARIERPRGAGWLFTVAAAGLLVAITLCIFWHAVLYPEVYWDSLILYMGYARMTFLEGGFPVKVVGQVGIGLGANYPHLYAALGAGVATASGEWSDLPQRMMAPLAGLASTVLVYHGALRLTRHVNMALAVALLYRATPLAIIYDQYGSDYALAILFMAGFLYLALLFVQTGMRGAFALATLTIALAMHLNYLMGILWLGWVLMIVAAHPLRGRGGGCTVDLSRASAGGAAIPLQRNMPRLAAGGGGRGIDVVRPELGRDGQPRLRFLLRAAWRKERQS